MLIVLPVLLLMVTTQIQAQRKMIPLNSSLDFVSLNVKYSEKVYLGKKSMEVFDAGNDTDSKLLKIVNTSFKNGYD